MVKVISIATVPLILFYCKGERAGGRPQRGQRRRGRGGKPPKRAGLQGEEEGQGDSQP
jgi:hypothetical protein